MNTLRDRMLTVMADVNAQVAEREELVELIAIALLTRKTCSSWARPARPKATPSTPSAAGSPVRGSLSGCCPSRPTKSSCSDASTSPA